MKIVFDMKGKNIAAPGNAKSRIKCEIPKNIAINEAFMFHAK